MARNRTAPPPFEPTPASRALKLRRVELGKSQSDVAFESEVLTQTTISELERGKYGPEDLTASRLGALARGLNWTVGELEAATGLSLGLGTGRLQIEAGHEPEQEATEPPQPLLPPALIEAIEKYGDTFPALRNPRVQEQLASARRFYGLPQTADGFLEFYLNNKRFISEE